MKEKLKNWFYSVGLFCAEIGLGLGFAIVKFFVGNNDAGVAWIAFSLTWAFVWWSCVRMEQMKRMTKFQSEQIDRMNVLSRKRFWEYLLLYAEKNLADTKVLFCKRKVSLSYLLRFIKSFEELEDMYKKKIEECENKLNEITRPEK